ncbi:MAG: glycosyltransferase family 2 protein [Elusimicrobia bacterium]|nr:glycosyltransferase family 2 protein [Elusimicrobiota bacterium]
MSPAARPALSLVIPCWNEAESLRGLLERFGSVLKRSDVELVLVDNGSTDRTSEVLPALLPSYGFARQVTLRENQGYGGGILAGLETAQGRFLGWTHADLQTDPADALRSLDFLESCPAPERTLVKGLREGRPLAAVLVTWGMALYVGLRLKVALRDINGQPVVFHRSFMDLWRLPPRDFTLDLYALYAAARHGWTVERRAVEFPGRKHGRSRWDLGLRSKWRMARAVAAACDALQREGV